MTPCTGGFLLLRRRKIEELVSRGSATRRPKACPLAAGIFVKLGPIPHFLRPSAHRQNRHARFLLAAVVARHKRQTSRQCARLRNARTRYVSRITDRVARRSDRAGVLFLYDAGGRHRLPVGAAVAHRRAARYRRWDESEPVANRVYRGGTVSELRVEKKRACRPASARQQANSPLEIQRTLE